MESKSLKTIQVLSKIAKVLCKIIFICCIVGASGCALGLAFLGAGITDAFKVGGVTIYGIIASGSEVSEGTMYAGMAVALVLCLGEIFLAKIAEKYFDNELKAGTPFTFEGARELFRLGICTISVSFGTIVAADIVYKILNARLADVADMHIDDYSSVALGITFLIISVIFKYGAEVIEGKKEA